MPSSPQKMSLSRSASSWTPARELGLALPPGGQNHHLQLHADWLTLHTTVHHTHTHLFTASVWHIYLENYQPATGAGSFHTIIAHCKYQPNKSTVFISWYWICMLMLKLAFSSIKHRQRVIYDSLMLFGAFGLSFSQDPWALKSAKLISMRDRLLESLFIF